MGPALHPAHGWLISSSLHGNRNIRRSIVFATGRLKAAADTLERWPGFTPVKRRCLRRNGFPFIRLVNVRQCHLTALHDEVFWLRQLVGEGPDKRCHGNLVRKHNIAVVDPGLVRNQFAVLVVRRYDITRFDMLNWLFHAIPHGNWRSGEETFVDAMQVG